MNNKSSSVFLLVRVPEIEYGIKTGDVRTSARSAIVIPLGFASLASTIREKTDYKVKAVDLYAELFDKLEDLRNKEESETLRLITESLFEYIGMHKPSVIGFSALYIFQHKLVKEICMAVRGRYPDIRIYVGGYPTISPEMIFNDMDGCCDVIFIGEAENTVVKVLEAENSGASLGQINGIAFKDDKGVHVVHTLDLVQDLNSFPLPAYDMLPLEKYTSIIGRREFPIMTSRSCPFDCSFCSSFLYSGRKMRFRSAASLMEEIRILKDRFGAEFLWIRDDNFNVNKEHAKGFLRSLISNNLLMPWCDSSSFNANSIDEELLDLCKETLCKEIIIAVESGSQRVLKEIMKKRVDLDHVKKMVAHTRKLKLPVTIYFVVGNPGETKEEIHETIAYAGELKADHYVFSIATPFPGTRYHKVAIEKGYLSDNPDYILTLKYMGSVMDTENFTAEWLKDTQYDANIRLNFLENRKVLSSDKELMLEGLARYSATYLQYNFHAVARLLEGYLNMRVGNVEKGGRIFDNVENMLKNKTISDSYSKYFLWDTPATNAYNKWLAEKKGRGGK
ncbi:MAG TPA: hypothetical protein DCZ94_09410 [Lentisphaeria bacterium]|nr:MAG: hypothetical protein A2X48_18235 [Lentisphaerae bacterium GWF2_49_21]HBC87158.1 hypothetical protein [Lentisphaeria bacterium]